MTSEYLAIAMCTYIILAGLFLYTRKFEDYNVPNKKEEDADDQVEEQIAPEPVVVKKEQEEQKEQSVPVAPIVPEQEEQPAPEEPIAPEPVVVEKEQEEQTEPQEQKVSFTDRLKKGLSRSRSEIWGKAVALFKNGVSDEILEDLEEILYSADIGSAMVSELIAAIEKENLKTPLKNEQDVKNFLFNFLKAKLERIHKYNTTSLLEFMPGNLNTILVCGVNGAGKTTTIGKLATKLHAEGAKVIVGACDTFRAAAVDQLQVWCDRAGVKMIRAKEGANPTGVAYDALQTAINEDADYCLLDTAGRLHNSENLMEELAKTKRVLQKLDEDAPQEVVLVLDAITGQNALRQATEFNKFLDITSLIFTKCDGSSKAGSAVTISNTLNVPISFIGVGEGVEDLDKFDLDDYLRALLDM